MEKYLIFGAITAILATILFFSRNLFNKPSGNTNLKADNFNVIRQPKVYLYVGIGGVIFFLCLGIFALLAPDSLLVQNEDWQRTIAFIVFIIICVPYIFIILLQINWKIEIGKDEFTFRNTFGHKRTYKYSEIKVKTLNQCTRYYFQEKHIVGISYLQTNCNGLEKAIQLYKKELKKQ